METKNLVFADNKGLGSSCSAHSGNYIIYQLLLASNLFHILNHQSILNLSLTSKTIWKCVRRFISNFLFFRINSEWTPLCYDVRRVRSMDLNSLTMCRNITHLELGDEFNSPLYWLPPHIVELSFGKKFNQPLINLPHSITNLRFGWFFNQSVDNLPLNTTYLTLGSYFSNKIDNLPPKLKSLSFGKYSYFNKSVDKLPSSLHTLSLGFYFNRPINNLPPNLQKLTLGYHFNTQINSLPPNLTQLTFHKHFNQNNLKLKHPPKTLVIKFLDC